MKGNIQKVNSSILWDLKPVRNIELEDGIKDIISEKDAVEEYAVTEILFPYREEIEIRRKKDAKIKEKYGLRSINYLLQESNDKLLQYQDKQMHGVDMSMPILNEDRRREDMEKKKELLIKEIRLESQLTVSEPRIIGIAAVIPSEKVSVAVEETSDKGQGNGMVSDEEIEKAGMEIAMTYEQKSEWKVEDVSTENLGFDIRSTKYGADGTFEDIKYIEVKARATEGAVRVSSNEWKKAKRFKDKFWLYIVTDAGSDCPQIKCIQNPAEELKLDEDIYATGYIIPLESWKAVSGLKVTS